MMPGYWLCFPQPECRGSVLACTVCGVQQECSGERSAQALNTPGLHGPGSQSQEHNPSGAQRIHVQPFGRGLKKQQESKPTFHFPKHLLCFLLVQHCPTKPETSPRALHGGHLTDRLLYVTCAPLGAPVSLGCSVPESPRTGLAPRPNPVLHTISISTSPNPGAGSKQLLPGRDWRGRT